MCGKFPAKKNKSVLWDICTAPKCTLNDKHIASLQLRKDRIGYAEIGTHLYTITVDQNTLIRTGQMNIFLETKAATED
jgi:hypothetical protein